MFHGVFSLQVGIQWIDLHISKECIYMHWQTHAHIYMYIEYINVIYDIPVSASPSSIEKLEA